MFNDNDENKKTWNDNYSIDLMKANFEDLSEKDLMILGNVLFSKFQDFEASMKKNALEGNLTDYAEDALTFCNIYNKMCGLLDYIHATYSPESIKNRVSSLVYMYKYIDGSYSNEMNRLRNNSK